MTTEHFSVEIGRVGSTLKVIEATVESCEPRPK